MENNNVDMQENLLHYRKHSKRKSEDASHQKHEEMYKKFNFLHDEPLTSRNIIPKALSLLK